MEETQKEFLKLLPHGTTLHAMHTITTDDGNTTIDLKRVFVGQPTGMSVCVLVKLDRLCVIVAPRIFSTPLNLPSESSETTFDSLAECADFVVDILSKYKLVY